MYQIDGQQINGDAGLPPGVSQRDIDGEEPDCEQVEGYESPRDRAAALAFLRSIIDRGQVPCVKIRQSE